MDMGRREERVRCMKRVTWPTGICCMAKKTQTGALQQPRGEGDGREMGGRFKREGIQVYPCLVHVEV